MTTDLFDRLTGRSEHELISSDRFLLDKSTLEAFQKLKQKAKEEADIDLALASSFRSFDQQLKIWNAKVTGERLVKDDFDKLVNLIELSDKEKIEKIMRFSAIPGASRHHWGTDIDIFDRSKIKREYLQLTPSECFGSGPNTKLHLWLDQKIKNSEAYGFYRPYDIDRNGVSPEKWHLSFAPIARDYFAKYTIDIFLRNVSDSSILLSKEIKSNADFYFSQYISNILV